LRGDRHVKPKGPPKSVYRILFVAQGQVYEVYAQSVGQGDLFGFVQVEGLLFGERSQMVVDPSEERLKTEFAGVKRFSVPIHSVLRVDEVEKGGVGRIAPTGKGEGILTPFPAPIYGRPPQKKD
jgi:hypothetical protein